MSDEEQIIFMIVGFSIAAVLTLIGKALKASETKQAEEKQAKQDAIDEVYGVNKEGPIMIEQDATVLVKSTEHHSGADCFVHQIVFQTSTGQRLCFAIKDDSIYQMILEGDVGELRFVQNRFESFTPKTK